MSVRMQHCFNCGAELGIYEGYHGDIEVCDERECNDAARDAERARDEEARYAAEQDDYERYR